MIITELTNVTAPDLPQYAWAGLRRFHHVPFVEEVICRLHNVHPKNCANARKQATQIRYCLIQAKEYYDAAAVTSLATKPTLLYYSLMSLALAEILLKQDGMSSLDKARAEHRHHGLELSVSAVEKNNFDLAVTAEALKAKPIMIGNSARIGTFELWHRSCREMPLCGKVTQIHQNGGSSSGLRTIFDASDTRLDLIPSSGISLLHCIKSLPGMDSFAQSHRVEARSLRGTLALVHSSIDKNAKYTLIIHPCLPALLQSFLANFMMEADAVNRVEVTELPSGAVIQWTEDEIRGRVRLNVPPASMWTEDQIRFWPHAEPLNEFGYMYVGLHMAGNYARYYPDRWMADVERSTPLALAIEQLITVAMNKMPLLTLSEMTRSYHVPHAIT